MRAFADTYFFLDALNVRDVDHERALGYYARDDVELVTTTMVLSEVASAFSPRATRAKFVQLDREMRADPTVTIVPVASELFERGIDLYAARSDKDWSLVDCISFAVMESSGLTEALSGDHHFKQAGFSTLLG
jgi:predicted nucleic acid-binding protein